MHLLVLFILIVDDCNFALVLILILCYSNAISEWLQYRVCVCVKDPFHKQYLVKLAPTTKYQMILEQF